MKRVAIVGTPGAGKSTLARELGERLGLPVIHLDREYFLPGWKPRPEAEWADLADNLLARDEWVMDGAFAMEKAVERADAIVFLDFAPWRGYVGSVKRLAAAYAGRSAPDFAPGCEDRLDRDFWRLLKTTRRYPRDERPEIAAELHRLEGVGTQIVIARNRRDLSRVARLLRR